jgi:hypothetical protein
MRVLYIAGNADGDSPLMETAEATELALLFQPSGGANLEFTALPDVPLHLLRGMIRRFQPDVLHFAAHGGHGVLRLRDDQGKATAVTARTLRAFFPTVVREAPALVYLNACDSAAIAADLKDVVGAAVAFEGKVSNAIARSAALMFYAEIVAGESIAEAHAVSASYVQAACGSSGPRSVLAQRQSSVPLYLCARLRLLARFGSWTSSSAGFEVHVGLEGIPQEVVQIVFTLVEPTLEDEIRVKEKDAQRIERGLAASFCRVITRPRRQERVWASASYFVRGDCDVYALLTFSDGRLVTASGRLSDALNCHAAEVGEEEVRNVRAMLSRLQGS